MPDHQTRGRDRNGLRAIIAAATSQMARPILNIETNPSMSRDTTMTQ
jgi:hypothetical protein